MNETIAKRLLRKQREHEQQLNKYKEILSLDRIRMDLISDAPDLLAVPPEGEYKRVIHYHNPFLC